MSSEPVLCHRKQLHPCHNALPCTFDLGMHRNGLHRQQPRRRHLCQERCSRKEARSRSCAHTKLVPLLPASFTAAVLTASSSMHTNALELPAQAHMKRYVGS